VSAAADTSYDDDFHRAHNSAWVVRRLTLLMQAPIPQYCELVATTWISTVARVRCTREYAVRDASTGESYYTGLVEWVYVSRETGAPLPVPPEIGRDFDVPGHHLQTYDPPHVPDQPNADPLEFAMDRHAEWHEADSLGHVNNTVYADWLDEAVLHTFASAGYDFARLRAEGKHLRGCYYNLSYKRSALPGDKVHILTKCPSTSGTLIPVTQTITAEDGSEVLTASSIYTWLG
jgi:acyl-CoA thioesterase FadM